MSRILETLKGARKLEVFLAMVAISILLLQGIGLVGSSGQTALENRLSDTLSQMNGVGRVRVLIMENADGHPEGALIVAEGADKIWVCLQIQYAVSTLLDLEAGQIEVVQYAK